MSSPPQQGTLAGACSPSSSTLPQRAIILPPIIHSSLLVVYEITVLRLSLQVWTILEEIPKLEFLNLTRNPLPQLTTCEDVTTYPMLKKLVLNFTGLDWNTITNLLTILPKLVCTSYTSTCTVCMRNNCWLNIKQYYLWNL